MEIVTEITGLPELYAHGIKLDMVPDKFGWLHEYQAGVESQIVLRSAMDEDGYVFLRSFWSREEVQAVRDSITKQLDSFGFLAHGYPRDEARGIAGKEVGRAMGNPLDQ